ncbi:MAG: primosomal protein N' [Burkholderiales bacterium]|nr:primosomal protein N' [Burkholderiales bacterium]MBK8664517.1 primosomal protein N' [Burkholderiales bacterium]
MSHWLSIAVPTPAHSGLAEPLTYRSEAPLPAGSIVRVPLGARELLGVVWGAATPPDAALAPQVRAVAGSFDGLAPLSGDWLELIAFTARYYQRALGEVALAALPPQLRTLDGAQLARRLKRQPPEGTAPTVAPGHAALSAGQAEALARIETEPGPFLLFGATGSGKTEVYMQAVQRLLARTPEAQALVLVPEINLTPQLEARFAARFGAAACVSLHSGLTPAQRLAAWLAAHSGRARIVLGTRVAVLASLPRLALIVVDEEHDPSYKQQEGARYSARDLGVYRGKLLGAKVILGSATPALESWHASTPTQEGGPGRYLRLAMPRRIGVATGAEALAGLPRVRRVDMTRQPRGTLIAPPLLAAIEARVARGEQALLLLNRRGWAPVLHCAACGWKSECPHCSAYRVFHKIDRTLRCHHCGFAQRVPRACPDCGNLDIGTIGRGTEQLEERLAELLAGVLRPDGAPVRIARIDADATRGKGQLEASLAQVHAGAVDVLVGTQMIAKGHDFRRVTLVAAIQPDAALFSSDFRAAERLFALLMQAAGRAGRDATSGGDSEMWVQTQHPQHPLYVALKAHDYPGFAAQQLAERAQAGLPPYSHLALLRAEGRSQQLAQDFLSALARAAQDAFARDPALAPALAQVRWYPPVPLAVQRVAGVERAQMLLESPSRGALQRVLAACQPLLHRLRADPAHRGLLRWAIDVDPLAV